MISKKSEKNIEYIIKNFSDDIVLKKKKVKSLSFLKTIYDNIKTSLYRSKKIHMESYETNDELEINQVKTSLTSGKFTPQQIVDYIDTYMNYKISHKLLMKNYSIVVNFYAAVDEKNSVYKFKKYVNAFDKYIKSWLFICDLYGKYKPGQNESMVIDVFMTPFTKKLPSGIFLDTMQGLDSIHVNSGVTTTSIRENKKSVTIFRKEEWFKVFIHETMHAFALDFQSTDLNQYKSKWSKEFPQIYSDFNFNESYCEFWAAIFNMAYYSYQYVHGNYKEFVITFEINAKIEQMFSIMQTNKILTYYGLSYDMMSQKTNENSLNVIYQENTNVFCYYVVKSILLYNYEKVFEWCNSHNLNFINFKESTENVKSFMEVVFRYKGENEFKSIMRKYHKMRNNSHLEMSLFEYRF